MRVRFTWQPKEWHEAVRLVTDPPRPRRDVPFMVYGILGITCLGGVGDLFRFLQTRQIEAGGGMLLMGSAFTAVAGSGAVWLTRTGLRRRRTRQMPPVPEGEQEAAFKESGWSAGAGTATESNTLQPWTTLHTVRTGTHAMVLLGTTGTFTALPLRALSTDESGYLHRLLTRKLKPAPQNGSTPKAASNGEKVSAFNTHDRMALAAPIAGK